MARITVLWTSSLMLLLLAACTGDAPTATPTPELEPTAQAGQQAEVASPPPTPTLLQRTPTVQEWSGALPPHLVRVEPTDGELVRIDFALCATFDITTDGLGREWQGPVWFDIDSTEIQSAINIVNSPTDPTEGTACAPGLRSLLEEDALESMPPVMEGPIDIAVRYQTPSGEQFRYSWPVELQLTPPQAPPEVHRVREAHDLFQKVRERVRDRVADHFLDLDQGVLFVYLTPSGKPGPVQSVVEEVFADKLPEGGVRIVPPDYPTDRLPEWYEEAQDAVWPVGGVWFSDHDEVRNRIEFGVQTEYVAYRARRALAKTGVPQEAVVIEVSPQNKLDVPPVQPDSPSGVGISLEFPEKVRVGQAIPFEVILTNQGESQPSFIYSPYLPANVMVFNANGDQMWARHLEGAIPGLGKTAELAPGEELRFKVYWDVTDRDGFSLSPGSYLVRGTSNISIGYLVTEPYNLVVEP